MSNNPTDHGWYIKMPEGPIHGPIDKSLLEILSGNGRIGPQCQLSQDKKNWQPASDLPELKMIWIVELEDGSTFGPFNLLGAPHLLKNTPIDPAGNLTNRSTGVSIPSRSLLKPLLHDKTPTTSPTPKTTDAQNQPSIETNSQVLEDLKRQLVEQRNQYSSIGEASREKIDVICSRIDHVQASKFKLELEKRKIEKEKSKEQKALPLTQKEKLFTQLDKKVSSLTSETMKKNIEYQDLQTNYERLINEFNRLEKELEREQSIHADLREKSSVAENDLQGQINALQTENQTITEKLRNTQQSFEEINTQHVNLVKSIKKEDFNQDELSRKVQKSAEQAVSQLNAIKQEFEQEKKQHSETRNAASTTERTTQNELKQARLVADASARKVQSLEARLCGRIEPSEHAQSTEEIKRLRTEIERLEKTARQAQEKHSETKVSLEKDKNDLQQKLAMLQKDVSNTGTLQQKSEEYKKSLDAERVRANTLKKELEALQALQEKLFSSQKEREQKIKADFKKQVESEHSQLVARIDDLQKQLTDNQEKIKHATDKLKQTEQQSSAKEQLLTSNIADMKKKADAVETALRNLEDAKKTQEQEFNNKITQLQKEHDVGLKAQESTLVDTQKKLSDSRTLLESTVNQHKAEIEKLAQANDSFKNRIQELDRLMAAKDKELANNKARQDETIRKHENLDAKLKQIQSEIEENKALHQKEIAEKDSSAQVLEVKLTRQAKAQHTRLTNKIARLEKDLDESSGMLGQASEELTKQRKQFLTMQTQLADKEKDLAQHLADLQEKTKRVKEEAEKAGKAKETEYSKQIEQLASRATLAENDSQAIRKQMSELQKQSESAVVELNRAKTQLAKLRKQSDETTSGRKTGAPVESREEQEEEWFLRLEDKTVYGPIKLSELCKWAEQCRIAPDHEISLDKKQWVHPETVKELEMKWTVELINNSMYGPVNIFAALALSTDGAVKPTGKLINSATKEEFSIEKLNSIIISELLQKNEQLKSALKESNMLIAQMKEEMLAAQQVPAAPALPPKTVLRGVSSLIENRGNVKE